MTLSKAAAYTISQADQTQTQSSGTEPPIRESSAKRCFFSFELSNSAKRHVKIKLLFYYWFWRLAYIFSIHAICAARETLIFWLLIESKWWCVAGHRLEKKNKSNSPRLMAEFISIAVNQINVRFECSVARFMSERERPSKPKTIDLPLAKRDCLISLHTKQYWLC